MELGNVLEFRKDLYFEGAVQADWFYSTIRAATVAENFVFHGKKYFGIEDNENANKKRIDTISLIEELAGKLSGERFNPLSLAIADYGTGKSHLAVTLAQIFSGPKYMPEVYSKIFENISNIDTEAADRIKNLCDEKNFVMVINGMRDFNLHAEILKAAQKSLKLYGLPDDGLKKLNRALETAEMFFERNAQNSLELFEKAAQRIGWIEKGNKLIERIGNELLISEETFDIINEVYLDINGQEIRWEEGISAATILEMLVTEYCGMSGRFDHVIILFDEFGRYLEYASGVNAAKSGDSALQQIFETAQNAEGALQVINFIQSDIKAYLQRVDQTKNISRYIGRYDASDKYYISSNLETVFANLIHRKDKIAFDNIVKTWQNKNEVMWKNTFSLMNKWLITKGMWKDYNLFRKVVVEGIYPMHPLSTFMLTQLSDYLQNRSSLTLISQYISNVAEIDLSKNMVLILPENLMKGDLFTEMLAAEQDGKQPSQQCIRYDNILRKYGDKLSEKSLAVLRANLIMRVLRFKTSDYNDAKAALVLCSGLSLEEIIEELNWLENEYALLGFDDHAGCFDFMEESNGAHDFKVLKKRIIANSKVDKSIFYSAKIMDIAGTLNLQTTNFGITRKIFTNEWNFKQELYSIDEFTDTIAESYLNEWKSACSSILPKGTLIWLYINKDTDIANLTRSQRLVKMYEGTPIIVMLLNDEENRLYNALLEYSVLDKLDDSNRRKYERHYIDDYRQCEINLKDEFDNLKKKREYLSPVGVKNIEARMAVALTNVFEDIYPKAVPFCFDGFVTKGNNLGGKGSTYYCSIIKMLLSGTVNYDNIHNFSNDVRNRIEAVLMTSASTSWKCINEQCQVIPPEDVRVKNVYDEIVEKITNYREIECKAIFKTYCYPPFGMSEDIVTLMISVICANLNYCLRFRLDNELISINNWKEYVVIKDKKIDIDVIKSSILTLVDAGAVAGKYIRLFERIENNRKLSEIHVLSRELDSILKVDELPEELDTRCKLAKRVLDDGFKVKNEWSTAIGSIDDKIEIAVEERNIFNALEALKGLEEIPIRRIFIDNNFEFAAEYKEELKALKESIAAFIDNNIVAWISNMHCRSVESITKFATHIKKMQKILEELHFDEYARMVKVQGDKELSNTEEIRSRQELREDCSKFFENSKIDRFTTYVNICVLNKEGKDLQERLEKYKLSLGKDAINISEQLKIKVEELAKTENRIKTDMSDIWDDLYEVVTAEDVEDILARIKMVLQKGIPVKDQADFSDLQENLELFLADINLIKENVDNRKKFTSIVNNLKEKYIESDFDFEVLPILEEVITNILTTMNSKEVDWKSRNLSLGDKKRETIHKWKDRTKYLPEYLSDETNDKLMALNKEADNIISNGKIEDVIYYFEKLDVVEKKKCITHMQQLIKR